jgi:hypothetical protein
MAQFLDCVLRVDFHAVDRQFRGEASQSELLGRSSKQGSQGLHIGPANSRPVIFCSQQMYEICGGESTSAVIAA